MDFHPVILAGGKGSRMYPLTEEFPKALLPVGNMPVIYYPIQLLEKNGFNEALVVVRDSQRRVISEALEGLQSRHGVRLKFTLCEIADQEWGTADSLRHIRSKVKGDVLLISCDLVTSCSLRSLLLFHHSHHSTLTSLLLHHPPPQDGVTLKKASRTSAVEKDLVGLTREARMVLFTSQADIEDEVYLSLATLHKHPHVQIFSQLMDSHIYLMRRWVLDYLAENKSLSSVKGELVPHLVRYQSCSPSNATCMAMATAARVYIDEGEGEAYERSSCTNSTKWAGHEVSCYAQVVEDVLCVRVNTLNAYYEANHLVSHHLSEFDLHSYAAAVRSKGVSGDSMVSGDGVVLGEKVSIKHSCLGQHCHIGDKTRIVNCIIMDHVHIGEGCVLQGSIVSRHACLEDHVSLKDCQVGANFTVTKEADLKGEALVVGGGMHF